MKALICNPAVRSAAFYAVALVFGKGVSFLMLPLVTGHLSPAEYGVVELLASVADVAGIVFGLGLADVLFRFGREEGMPSTLLGFSLSVGLLLGIAGQFAAPALVEMTPVPVALIDLRILSASLALTAAIQVPLAYLRYRDRPALFAVVSVGKAAVQASLVAVFLIAGGGVTAVLAGGLIADGLVAVILVGLQVREAGIGIRRKHAKLALGYGMPLVASGMAGFCLGSFDRWVLAGHVSVEDLAFYGLAAKFGLIAALAMQPFEMWWFPRRFSLLETEEGRRQSADIVGIGFVYGVMVVSGVAALGPYVITWMTPLAYHPAAGLVPWLALIALLHTTSNLVNVGCYAGQTTVLPMCLNGLAAVVAVTGYILLIPPFGVMGTIAATLIAQSVRLVLFFVFSQRRVRIPHHLLRSALLASATVLLFVGMGVIQLSDFYIFIPLASLGAAFALGLLRAPERGANPA
ncbi:lipopolysaccharide biosynthesis protein [Nisaea nitritireducens]|uniref:lipopolysaccharide biosynthesis protein n=1 Tax=Nisaea nitritireducens TaxID=568392 RepID=UPI001868C0DB|nr:oligosaccharide flippase family protein [Nisaea nitritireducens]